MAERDVAGETEPPGQRKRDGGEDAVNVGPDQDRVVAVGDQMWHHLGRLYLHESVIGTVRGNYFGGHAILFPAESQRIRRLVGTAEAIVDEYNGFVSAIQTVPVTEARQKGKERSRRAAWDALAIRPEDVKRSAAAAIRQEVMFFVRMTKAETLIALGQNQEGYNLVAGAYQQRQRRP